MRSIPPDLQAKLDSGVTTLCRRWVISRNDGVVQGFTDHDEDVPLDGVTCLAGSGLAGSEATQKLGLAVDGSELSGALASDTLNEDDLAAGRYDAAGVTIWLVDWSEPSLRVLLAKGALGEVRREGAAFTAEVRGLSDRLAQESGRLYTTTCAADLGDGRCNIDLTGAAYRGSGTVAALSATSSFTASGLDVRPSCATSSSAQPVRRRPAICSRGSFMRLPASASPRSRRRWRRAWPPNCRKARAPTTRSIPSR